MLISSVQFNHRSIKIYYHTYESVNSSVGPKRAHNALRIEDQKRAHEALRIVGSKEG